MVMCIADLVDAIHELHHCRNFKACVFRTSIQVTNQ